MKKSLFRLTDLLELNIAYAFCFFLHMLFDYVKTLDLDAYLLKVFLKNFMDNQPLIVLLFTFIVIAFHYQMLHRKNTEIFCKILVGDTVFNITIRYILDCLTVLIFVYLLTTLVNIHLNFSITGNFYLIPFLVTYLIMSTRQVRKYENL